MQNPYAIELKVEKRKTTNLSEILKYTVSIIFLYPRHFIRYTHHSAKEVRAAGEHVPDEQAPIGAASDRQLSWCGKPTLNQIFGHLIAKAHVRRSIKPKESL